jgi:hypothetical protein
VYWQENSHCDRWDRILCYNDVLAKRSVCIVKINRLVVLHKLNDRVRIVKTKRNGGLVAQTKQGIVREQKRLIGVEKIDRGKRTIVGNGAVYFEHNSCQVIVGEAARERWQIVCEIVRNAVEHFLIVCLFECTVVLLCISGRVFYIHVDYILAIDRVFQKI